MRQVLEPVIAAYAPDLTIVSAGFDAVVGDPLGGMSLSPELFGHLTERMARLARGRLVLALEGGYNLRMTAECARQCMQVCPLMHCPSALVDAGRFSGAGRPTWTWGRRYPNSLAVPICMCVCSSSTTVRLSYVR